jgi:DNA-binding PadR family transcriptional regulator
VAKRSGVLEFAVLGLLHEAPMHGYELRKRLNAVLGTFHSISYGSLYPCLKDLTARGAIVEAGPADAGAPALSGKRARIVYMLTGEGKDRFAEMLAETGPESWEDERFGVHFAFFSRTDAQVRRRILEGRRSRLEERKSDLRASLARTREKFDSYTLELQRHGLDSVEREVHWIDGLLEHEAEGVASSTGDGTAVPSPDSRRGTVAVGPDRGAAGTSVVSGESEAEPTGSSALGRSGR